MDSRPGLPRLLALRRQPNLLKRINVNCPTGKSLNSCPVAGAKIFRFTLPPNQNYIHRCPGPQRGVSRSSQTLGRDAVDAAAFCARRDRRARRSRTAWMVLLAGPLTSSSRRLTSRARGSCVRPNGASRHARIRACTHLSRQSRSMF
jgi:hypothetical protein